jgi:indolepyruvate ferredoxin oxidoreductase beta subunit
MSQRGGDVQSNLRISSEPIASDLIPQGGADLIVSLEPMESLRYIPYLSKSGWIVTNTAPFINIPNYPEMETVNAALDACPNVVAFNMDDMAKEVASPRTSNMVLLGAASPFLNIEIEKIEDGINTIFGAKGEAIVEMNIKAFRAGLEYTQNLLKSR